ncbi:ion channel domain-containing protein [Ditylenchus destructor]|uniref:Ion channel domain-containing protein n=1 Tax=Ditylenchus destructor TaxID=166010 RepID=A0AAD4NBX1_9BILA|nr:ion channel domain-containing protein [Ditylenchus destructor]
MLWNLVVNKYERYHLTHVLMLVVLGLYSLIGAIIFCSLERPNELRNLRMRMENAARKSSLARDRLLYDLQYFFVNEINVKRLLSRELNTTLDYYDRLMGFQSPHTTSIEDQSKWTIWGGLYFAGTVYTTIGYGDIVTETAGGKLFTVIYAIIGIPLVITVLNVWGGGLFQLTLVIWRGCMLNGIRRISSAFKGPKKRKPIYVENDYDEEDEHFIMTMESTNSETSEEKRSQEEEASKLPLQLAITLLLIWIFICAGIFCLFQKWTFLDAAYFFFISLTTIGLGDSIAEHKVACMYFLLILIGLAVVSMSISILQVQIEGIFSKIVRSINNDFKKNLAAEKRKRSLATSIGEERKISANTVAITVPNQKQLDQQDEDEFRTECDALQKYGRDMGLSEKLLIQLMSNHQRRMLNEKMRERQQMRNVGIQTEERKITAAAQTDQIQRLEELHRLIQPQESTESSSEDETPVRSLSMGATPKNAVAQFMGSSGNAGPMMTTAPRHHRPRGLSRKKLYIYNIGD